MSSSTAKKSNGHTCTEYIDKTIKVEVTEPLPQGNSTTPKAIKVRTVQSGQTEGKIWLRYSPKTPKPEKSTTF